MNPKVIACDLDGILCKGNSWTLEEALNAEPIQENIDSINKIGKTNFIVIWTARRDDLIPATLKWLRKHGVEFQAISNKKMAADYYLDDKQVSFHYLREKIKKGESL